MNKFLFGYNFRNKSELLERCDPKVETHISNMDSMKKAEIKSL